MPLRAVVKGIGHAAPSRVMTNDDVAQIVDTNDEWIQQRTGIRQRHVAAPGETASQFSIEASKKALAMAGIQPEELDLVIVGTVTGDYVFPSTSCLVQDALGAKNAGAFDLSAACAGFIYAADAAAAQIESGRAKTILVVGVDLLTKFVDWTDRSTCVLFGDGAGALVLRGEEGDRGILQSVLLSDGAGGCHIKFEIGGSKHPITESNWEELKHGLYMAGSEVYRFAVNAMGDACTRVLEKAGLTVDDVDLFVPHQANLRIIRSSQQRLGLPDDKVFVNVDRYGNVSGGSIPIALSEASEQGLLKPGSLVMTVGFGAGLVWGANLIRW